MGLYQRQKIVQVPAKVYVVRNLVQFLEEHIEMLPQAILLQNGQQDGIRPGAAQIKQHVNQIQMVDMQDFVLSMNVKE